MIVVLADDFSGAAEIAGAASRRGLLAEVQVDFDPASPARVLVVDTNTRSLPPEEAAERAGHIAAQVRQSKPSLIFKKIDSLLRGPILAEIQAVSSILGVQRTVLAVSNPSLGRVVSHGILFVQDMPVAETELARDPEHPIRSSRVTTILQSNGDLVVQSVGIGERLPAAGVCVVDATSAGHLERWAQAIDSHTLAVGAAEFFQAVLSAKHLSASGPSQSEATTQNVDSTELMVCGSRAAWRTRELECKRSSVPVLLAPIGSPVHDPSETAWLQQAQAALINSRRLLVGLGDRNGEHRDPHQLVIQLTAWVARLIQETRITRLLIEGGATASALARYLRWSRLRVASVPAAGVVELDVLDQEDTPVLLVKPGSYTWPDSVRQHFFTNG